MTQDEIIRMAREAGASNLHNGEWVLFGDAALERFAALVVEATKAQPQGEPVGYWNGKETAWFEHELCGHPAPDDCTIPLYTTPPSVEAAIKATKEKAAKVCEELAPEYEEGKNMAVVCAAAIRSMK
jgi:hypothetical protein